MFRKKNLIRLNHKSFLFNNNNTKKKEKQKAQINRINLQPQSVPIENRVLSCKLK